jgi:hypothetical protein
MTNQGHRVEGRRPRQAKPSRYWRRNLLMSAILYPLSLVVTVTPALARPSQEDVFRSIQSNVSGENSDGGAGSVLLLVLAGVGVLVLLAVLNKREKRVATPQTVNHAGKLLREMRKRVGLKPAELKQLKLLSESLATDDQPAPSPLTLLICPSVLSKALQTRSPKIDRDVLAGLVKRLKTTD